MDCLYKNQAKRSGHRTCYLDLIDIVECELGCDTLGLGSLGLALAHMMTRGHMPMHNACALIMKRGPSLSLSFVIVSIYGLFDGLTRCRPVHSVLGP